MKKELNKNELKKTCGGKPSHLTNLKKLAELAKKDYIIACRIHGTNSEQAKCAYSKYSQLVTILNKKYKLIKKSC